MLGARCSSLGRRDAASARLPLSTGGRIGARRDSGELAGTVPEIYQRLTAAWRYAVKAAKVPHYRFHDLRHTYGTILRREGKTFSDLAAIMRISEAMAHVYAHEDTEKLQREAIEAKLCTNSALSALARLA
jgi:integrase